MRPLAIGISAALAWICLASGAPGADNDVAIGSSARLTQGGQRYSGYIIAPDWLAPCDRKSASDDIKFDPAKDVIEAWRPCPNLPKMIPADVAHYLMEHDGSIQDALDQARMAPPQSVVSLSP